jgi:lysophospholipase L1-like esterase
VNESPEAIAALRQSLGFHSIATRFHPPVYFQRYPRVQGQFDADYSNFSLQSRQTAALNQVLRFAQIRNIPVVLANLPLTPTYLDRTRTRYEEQFQTFLKQLARSRQVTVFNLNIPQLGHNHYFMDPSHLNSHGAKVVSERLAKELASRLPELW